MADKNWQAGGMNLILAQAVVCLAASIAPFRAAWALSGKFSPATYLGNADPGMVGEGLISELPDGRSILVKHFPLPNGGSISTHLDCSEQRALSRQLASTKQFLESVLDHVPVCVAAKSIEDGRYIFANRAFERFSRFS